MCSRNWCGWIRAEGSWKRGWGSGLAVAVALLCTKMRQLCQCSDWGTWGSKTVPCSQRNGVYFGGVLSAWKSECVSSLGVVVAIKQTARNSAFPGQLREGGRRKRDESDCFIWCSFASRLLTEVVILSLRFSSELSVFILTNSLFPSLDRELSQALHVFLVACILFHGCTVGFFGWKLLSQFLPPPKKLPSLFLSNLIRNVINYLQVITLFCRLNILLWASRELQLQSHKANYALEYLVGLIWFEISLWRSRLCH